MSKITLNNVADLTQTTTAAATINGNFSTIQTAFDNTLSRDGTSPNQMAANLDMNSNRILNLPGAITANEPLRLQDLSTFVGGGTVTNIPAGGTIGQVLAKNSSTNYDISWSSANANPTSTIGLTTINGSAVTFMRSDAAPALSASVQAALTGTNNQLLLGTGVFGHAPLGSLGTATTVLHGNASGAPTFGAVNLGTDVTGTLLAGQFPALTGDVTTTAGSFATTLNTGVAHTWTAIQTFKLGGAPIVLDNTGASQQALITANSNGTAKWQFGKQTDDSFLIFDNVSATNKFQIASNGNMTLMGGGGTVSVVGAINAQQSGDTFTFNTPPPGFGGNWFSVYDFSTNYTATHADSRATVNITRTTNGSGTTGPATADFGAFVSVSKNNYLSSAIEGEIDGLYVNTAQGNKGDVSSVLGQAQKVRGGVGATGGALGSELGALWIDTSGNTLMNVHALSAFAEGAGGQSGNTGFGFYAESLGATPAVAASTVQPYAAFYGGAFDLNGNAPAHPPIFTNLLVGAGSRASAHVYFAIGAGITETGDILVGSGNATGLDGNPTQSGGTRWTMKNVSGDWRLYNNAGANTAYIQQSGTMQVGGPFGAPFATITSATGSAAIFNVINSHNTSGDSVAVIAGGPTSATETATTYVAFEDGAQTIIYGSIKRATGSAVVYNTTSDQRLKNDLGQGSRGLDDLMKIKVHDFTFKDDPTNHVIEGYFAQELAEIYPEAVSVGGDDPIKNPWQIDYGRLTPLLVKSIQDQQAQIEYLKTKIEEMK